MESDLNPIAFLRDYDERYRVLRRPLPAGAVEQGSVWRGIAFELGGKRLVSGMEQVREVLTDPIISPVPGAKAWVRGLASVRGRLVTIVDLADFLGVPRGSRLRGQRALFVELGDLQVAFLVDQVFGAKQLPEESRTEGTGDLPGVLRPYISSSFSTHDEDWSLFDLSRVLADPEFLNAAA